MSASSMSAQRGPNHGRRSDIQGLRTVAVVAVITNHIWEWPRGGFLGVDVFFVISGYLITRLLLNERERTGRISITAFYNRRLRRILPLAIVVLAVTVTFARFEFAPARASSVTTDSFWSLIFMANWRFAWTGTNYFNFGSAPSPLQHYWSLSVEEQFYLIWPLLIITGGLVASRWLRGRRHVTVAALAIVIGVASLLWAWQQTDGSPTVAYFSSLTRAWELAAGALLATLRPRHVRLAPFARSALSWIGLAGIVVAYFWVDSSTGIPAPGSILVVVPTLVCLTAGIGEGPTYSYMLTNPVSNYLGDISYGLYLWHFPLIAFVATLTDASSAERGVIVLVAALALASASHYLFERPIMTMPGTMDRFDWREWWAGQKTGVTAGSMGALVSVTAVLVAGAMSVSSPAVAGPAGFDPAEVSSVPTAGSTTAPGVAPTTSLGRKIQSQVLAGLKLTSWSGIAGAQPGDIAAGSVGWDGSSTCPHTDMSNDNACVFGTSSSGDEIDVFGDSIALNLMASVVKGFSSTHKIHGMIQQGCSQVDVRIHYGKASDADACRRGRTAAIAYVKKTRPDVLIIANSYRWSEQLASGAKGDQAIAEWIAAEQRLVNSLAGSAKHIVIVSPPPPGSTPGDCYRRGGSPADCVYAVKSDFTAMAAAESKISRASFVNTEDWYCVSGRCPVLAVVNGEKTLIRVDEIHPTGSWDRHLAPVLAEAVRRIAGSSK